MRLRLESLAGAGGSGQEQSDATGRSLVKRYQESELALISVIFFISASPERSEIPLVEKK